ncbi:MAG TPA: lipid-binding SYLF domain-containing protein [Candidatus Krumholzibacteria bacterium]
MKHRVVVIAFLAVAMAAPILSLAGDDKKTDPQTTQSTMGQQQATTDDQIKQNDEPKRLSKSAEVIRDFATMKEGPPRELVNKAAAVVIIPDLMKAGLGVGGKHGEGVLSKKIGDSWSEPVYVKLTGGSVGFQAGVSSTDLVLLFMRERDVPELIDGEFTLGGDAAVAAGPLGRQGTAGTDAHFDAPIYSYSRSKGLFAGISVDGSKLYLDKDAMARAYTGSVKASELILKSPAPGTPGAELVTALQQLVKGQTPTETGSTDESSTNVGKK